MTTFYPLTSTIRYPRCEVPARALGASILEVDDELRREDPCARQDGVGIWQLAANRGMLFGMTAGRQYGPSVLEVDDDYTRFSRTYARGTWTEDAPPKGDNATPSVAIHRLAAANADAVIVATPRLAAVYGELNPNVFVCPNCVDPDDWPELREPDGVFRVLYSGAPNHNDFKLIREGMEWAAAQPGVEAWVMGVNQRDLGYAKTVKVVPWLKDLSRYRQVMAKIRPQVGLRPLIPSVFASGKSDLKVLEYAMVGGMSIVADHDPYHGWRNGPVRFAHANQASWTAQIKWAVRNRDEVAAVAAECRTKVLAERTLGSARTSWGAATTAITS